MTPVNNLLDAQRALNESAKAELHKDYKGALEHAKRAIDLLHDWSADIAEEQMRHTTPSSGW